MAPHPLFFLECDRVGNSAWSLESACAVLQPVRQLERDLAAAIEHATDSAWRLGRAYQEEAGLFLAIEGEASTSLLLEVRAARPDVRAYLTLDGRSFGYRGSALDPALRPLIDRTFRACAAVLTEHRWDPETDTLTPVSGDSPAFPTPRHRAHLDAPRTLSALAADTHRETGMCSCDALWIGTW